MKYKIVADIFFFRKLHKGDLLIKICFENEFKRADYALVMDDKITLR